MGIYLGTDFSLKSSPFWQGIRTAQHGPEGQAIRAERYGTAQRVSAQAQGNCNMDRKLLDRQGSSHEVHEN